MEANAKDPLVPDSLSPVEGTAPSYRRTDTPVNGSVKCPPNVRYLTRFVRYLSTTGPITASWQERQIVQSQLNLDDFLRAPWKGARS